MGQTITEFIANYGELMLEGTRDTLVMTGVSTLLAYVLGVPLGVLLTITGAKSIWPNQPLNTVLGWIVNIGRSIPFIILLVAIIPFTRLIVGTSLGVEGAMVPLVISAAPFVARVVEQSLADVDGGLIEAAQSFGANNWQIVTKVLLFESCRPSCAAPLSPSSTCSATRPWPAPWVPAAWATSPSATATSATSTT